MCSESAARLDYKFDLAYALFCLVFTSESDSKALGAVVWEPCVALEVRMKGEKH